MCGDHTKGAMDILKIKGSPPHVRGPLIANFSYLYIYGITPACAGTTSRRPAKAGPSWDHPRMCGDHYYKCYN